MDTLKKAGAMLAHLDLFHSMLDLRRLLQLAAHMRERGDRAMLVSEGEITLIGADTLSAPEIVTTKGETIDAVTAHRVLQSLKGYASSEYAVNHEELGALNARAVADLEGGDALRAFGDTLARIGAAPSSAPSPAPSATADAPEARPTRPRRSAEAETARSEAEGAPAA